MKTSFATICINPSFPIRQRGFLSQKDPVFLFRDDLHAYITALEDENVILYLIACDSLGVEKIVTDTLQKELQRENRKPIHVIISATHTHFAPDSRDPRYQAELVDLLLHAVHAMKMEEHKVTISIQTDHFEGVGKSRITGHKAEVILQLVSLYQEGKPWLRAIVHNCHPTIHSSSTPYFTSEYPGYVLSHLKDAHEKENFVFLQSAAGDVSARFTRPSQDYEGVKVLGNRLVEKMEEMMQQEAEQKLLDHLSYEETDILLEHSFEPLDLSEIRSDISERERSEIQTGQIVRAYLEQHPLMLPKDYLISCVTLGDYHMVYAPMEAFSSWLQYFDLSRSSLICYSNGYCPYLRGIDENVITYESFTDTVQRHCKEEVAKAFEKYGK